MFTVHLPGLGTSTSKEAKEYFADMERHRIMFKYNGTEDDAAITLVSWSLLVLFVLRLVQHYIYSDINCTLLLTNWVTLCVNSAQAFSKKKTDDRKEWLTNFMEDRRQRRMHGLPEVQLSITQK